MGDQVEAEGLSDATISLYEELSDKLDWFHPSVSRHAAESMLLQFGKEGTYLLRPSSLGEQDVTLSVRGRDTVRHYNIQRRNKTFLFGEETFESVEGMVKHFGEKPLIAGETGVLTVLKHPYPRDLDEPAMYERIRVHAVFGTRSDEPEEQLKISGGSKEGYLTKQGGNIKSWKLRWFVLIKNELKYFKERQSPQPIRTLDLEEALDCQMECNSERKHCFSLVFNWRTFYMVASSQPEAMEWVNILQSKIRTLRH